MCHAGKEKGSLTCIYLQNSMIRTRQRTPAADTEPISSGVKRGTVFSEGKKDSVVLDTRRALSKLLTGDYFSGLSSLHAT